MSLTRTLILVQGCSTADSKAQIPVLQPLAIALLNHHHWPAEQLLNDPTRLVVTAAANPLLSRKTLFGALCRAWPSN